MRNNFTVVVPFYNAESTIINTIKSINNIKTKYYFDVLFVDDCSSDNTVSYINQYSLFNYTIINNSTNSGGPMKGRNKAIQSVKTEFIIFLDSDDTICENIDAFLDNAIANNFDIVRGFLERIENDKVMVLNKLGIFEGSIKENIVKNQSTTNTCILRTKFLQENKISYNENIRLGEDTLFFIEAYSKTNKIGYIDQSIQKYFIGNHNSTSNYNQDMLIQHLYVWSKSAEFLECYNTLKGPNNISNLIRNLIKHKVKLNKETFFELSNYVNDVGSFEINGDLLEMYEIIKNKDFESFNKVKKKLTVYGQDLKFISKFYKELQKEFDLEVEEVSSHYVTDSTKLPDSDIILCEWFLEYAVWLSNNKKENQKLFIRLHRFELTRDFIKNCNYDNVDGVIVVSYYFYLLAIEKGVPSNKLIICPNAVEFDLYQKWKEPTYNIAIIGILPKRKAFLEALKIIKTLKEKYPRINLNIYGQEIKDLPWLQTVDEEVKYYNECADFISNNNMENNVRFNGWAKIEKVLSYNDFVLSVSDNEKIGESFHVSPLEGFASKVIPLFKYWQGVEYIYPDKYIFNTCEEITYKIDEIYEKNLFNNYVEEGHEYCKKNYDMDVVSNKLIGILNS